MSNSKTVPVKISRRELADLIVACYSVEKLLESEGYDATKWESLHDKLKDELTAFDAKNGGNEHEQHRT